MADPLQCAQNLSEQRPALREGGANGRYVVGERAHSLFGVINTAFERLYPLANTQQCGVERLVVLPDGLDFALELFLALGGQLDIARDCVELGKPRVALIGGRLLISDRRCAIYREHAHGQDKNDRPGEDAVGQKWSTPTRNGE